MTRDKVLLRAVKAAKPGPIKVSGVEYTVVERSDEEVHPRIQGAVYSLQVQIASRTGRQVNASWQGNRCSVTLINPNREDMDVATDMLTSMIEEATRVLDVDGRLPILGVEITLGGYNEPDGVRPWNVGSA